MKRKCKVTLAYDGTGYTDWQHQRCPSFAALLTSGKDL